MCEKLFFDDEPDREMSNADIAAASMHHSRKTAEYKYAR